MVPFPYTQLPQRESYWLYATVSALAESPKEAGKRQRTIQSTVNKDAILLNAIFLNLRVLSWYQFLLSFLSFFCILISFRKLLPFKATHNAGKNSFTVSFFKFVHTQVGTDYCGKRGGNAAVYYIVKG